MQVALRLVHAERAALVADLADVPAERWRTASLCPGWNGEDVRRPLGLTREYPTAAVVPALEHQLRTKVAGPGLSHLG